ncbi:glycosyltransferase family 2 protein [Chryseobacterium sp.]|uniref:glycosyltransferase family 2 protein n=1 Tax=Chryseobacterium sp. TaxID=1871047 RepID=UPI002896683F|nr:glycosyltransferase family 2 protein [Chryseobacterium sp.]
MTKLSVCIPVYNFDARELVFSLKKQISARNLSAEIIVIDDFSERKFLSLNSEIQNIANDFVALDKNLGRSKIRNLFLKYTKGEYLLFLDCDGKIISDNFVVKYLNFINQNPATNVIYGGRNVSEVPLNKDHLLRWKFAIERENLPVEKRKENPYLSFQTNNFIVKREVLEKIPFNSEYNKYGYEDLLFAMDLKIQNISIDHIENPILNDDVETNEIYLKKVKESVESISLMLQNDSIKRKISMIKLVKTFNKLNFFPVSFLLSIFFKVIKKSILNTLLRGNKSLKYLDLYKLGLLLEMQK